MNALDLKDIQMVKFPGGELHPTVLVDPDMPTHVYANIWSSNDIMSLLLTCEAIKAQEVNVLHLTIPYFPYARQDRRANPGEALGVKVMAKLINSIGAASVGIWDPHSDVTPALIDRVVVLPQEVLAMQACSGGSWDAIVAPDAGASKKAFKSAEIFSAPLVQAFKHRDTKTGEITETTCPGDFTGQRLLIIDDICDGGRSFIELAKVLRAQGAASVDLYVTHGIFSRGEDALHPYIDTIHCANRRPQ